MAEMTYTYSIWNMLGAFVIALGGLAGAISAVIALKKLVIDKIADRTKKDITASVHATDIEAIKIAIAKNELQISGCERKIDNIDRDRDNLSKDISSMKHDIKDIKDAVNKVVFALSKTMESIINGNNTDALKEAKNMLDGSKKMV